VKRLLARAGDHDRTGYERNEHGVRDPLACEALRLLVLHDDADREFAYTTGAEDALDRAKTHDWTVVSMKEDWSAVFVSA
jgi:hypothetical protein